MVTVTPRAKQVLTYLLKERDIPEEKGFRLIPDPLEGFSLLVSNVKPGDQVIEHDGLMVLLVGADIAQQVDGASVDVYDTMDGPALKFNHR